METTSGIALISGLGGGAGFGENILERNDDASTDSIDITSIFENGLDFYGRVFTSLWVNNNGSITFNGPRGAFTPSVITDNNNNPEITPFFADVDTRGGLVTTSPGGNSVGSNLVYYDFDTVNDRFIATWDDVGYYSSNTDLTNAFQLILVDQQNGDFDIQFRYENITWTTGDASDGEGGLGGTPARAGYTASTGDPLTSFELPASGNEAGLLILDEVVGNTGQIGFWEFSVRSGDVQVSQIPALPAFGPSGWTAGDPHLLTLDGLGYDFHAAGEFVLLRHIGDSPFELQSRMTPVGNDVSVNRAVAARLDGGVVMLDSADAQPLSIDGVVTAIEDFGFVDVGNDRVFREGNVFTIVLAGGDDTVNAGDSQIIITVYDGRVDIDMRLNGELAGQLEGLLGDGDGDVSNDIALADGTVLDRPLAGAQLYGQYRDDWRVDNGTQSLFTYDAGESLESFYLPNYPGQTNTLSNFSAEEVAAVRQIVRNAGLIEGTLNFENAVLDFLLTADMSFVTGAISGVQVAAGNGVEVTPIAPISLVGDDGPNQLDGGSQNDRLAGFGSNDLLRGFGGNDRLDGGAGNDTMEGGLGNDRYVVDSVGDVIQGEIGFSQRLIGNELSEFSRL
jgi:Ca2+-binding RTX toxin-like protein